MDSITAELVRALLPRRDPGGHKGTFGKVCGILYTFTMWIFSFRPQTPIDRIYAAFWFPTLFIHIIHIPRKH